VDLSYNDGAEECIHSPGIVSIILSLRLILIGTVILLLIIRARPILELSTLVELRHYSLTGSGGFSLVLGMSALPCKFLCATNDFVEALAREV